MNKDVHGRIMIRIKLLDQLWNFFNLKLKKVKYGKALTIFGRVHIHGKKEGIEIGDNCIICSGEDYNPTSSGSHTHLSVGENGKLVIGDNVGMSLVHITAFCNVTIEDDVLLGAGTKIWDTDFHPIRFTERKKKLEPACSPIKIQEGAFIGACSIILKGVTIGRYSVIGAGSVVTKDIPEGEVWAGNPARYIKKV